MRDYRSNDLDISKHFSISFWIYPNDATDVLKIFASDELTTTFRISLDTSGFISAGFSVCFLFTSFFPSREKGSIHCRNRLKEICILVEYWLEFSDLYNTNFILLVALFGDLNAQKV